MPKHLYFFFFWSLSELFIGLKQQAHWPSHSSCMMEILWEDQLLLFQFSKWIPKGKRTSKIQTEVVGYLKNQNAQLSMCCLCFPSALCNASHSVKLTKCFCKGFVSRWNDALCISVSSHLLGSVLQQHFWASQVDACSQDLIIKRFPFPFTTVLFSWDTAHCQENVSLLSKRDILRCFT